MKILFKLITLLEASHSHEEESHVDFLLHGINSGYWQDLIQVITVDVA